MIYITGDTHNIIDMHNASAKQMKRYCGLQNVDYSDITNLIILEGDTPEIFEPKLGHFSKRRKNDKTY